MGNVDGKSIIVGNEAMMIDLSIDISSARRFEAEFSDQGKTSVFAVIDGMLAGIIAIADTINPHK